MTRRFLPSLLALAVCGSALVNGSAIAADPAANQASAPAQPTATFVVSAAVGNTFEIESSKLALDRSKSGPIKTFAQRIIDDHSAAAVKLKEAALAASITMPPDILDAKHRAMFDELKGKSGPEFDKAYIDDQYKAHVEAVELFTRYGQGGENAQIREFARQQVPVLKQHLDHVSKMR